MDELKVGGYINFNSNTLGLDSKEHCFSKQHYNTFPHEVSYQFNSLGYRDRSVDLYVKDPIIAIGDSFTLGLGLPYELTYPAQLEKRIGHQVLNFSLNGASNDWIARKLGLILNHFAPRAIIIHYTFSHRREANESTWFDDERTLCKAVHTVEENYLNWQMNDNLIKQLVKDMPAVYSFIPDWHPNEPAIVKIDLARDSFHYGVKTCEWLADYYKDQL